jgi:hypothetical protein
MIAGFSDGRGDCERAMVGRAVPAMHAMARSIERPRKHFIVHAPVMVMAGDYSLDEHVKIRTIT